MPDAAGDDADTVVLTDANAIMIDDGTVEVDPDATDTDVLVDAGSAPAVDAATPAAASTPKKSPKR